MLLLLIFPLTLISFRYFLRGIVMFTLHVFCFISLFTVWDLFAHRLFGGKCYGIGCLTRFLFLFGGVYARTQTSHVRFHVGCLNR